ncbi:MAG: PAS domain-containing protein, partial [Rhodospirillaceae bacterium]|nr:PAS domain-containing protein [Rhodospirillaceae bacterium]
MKLDDLHPLTGNCQNLADAWVAWRGDGLLPKRSDMRLEDISGILPYVCLVDVISETEIIFRLAGTMMREIIGVELTGRNLLELTEPEYRAKRGARTMQNATLPCGALWIWEIAFAGQESRRTENLSLPVKPDEP